MVAHTFLSWLEWFVVSLEAGVWRVDPDSGNFEPVNPDDPMGGGPLHPHELVRGDARKPP